MAAADGAADGAAGWVPRPRPEPVRLQGSYVEVEPLSSAHYADLFAMTCGPDDDALWTYRLIDRPTSLTALWMHLAGIVDSPVDVSFALVPREGPSAGRAAGVASYLRIEPAHGQVEVGGILLGAGLRRTRAGTEAIHLLMRHAFDDLGYRRLEWKCDSRNEPSRQAAGRLGFTHEGRFRNHMVVKGRNRDTDWFSVTDAEWPGVRARHEAWLDPANFDTDGIQVRSLARPALTTLEGLTELRASHAARIPGWQAPVAWALAVDGELPRVNLPGGAHGLASVSLALGIGHDGSTATLPVSRDQLAKAITLLEPAEACTLVEHPNLGVWRAALAGGHELAAVFVADLSDPVTSDLDSRLRDAL